MKMYALYSFLFLLSLVVVIPVYFMRIRLRRREPLFLKERLGFKLPAKEDGGKSIWIHAVSVGEVLSLQNLLKRIKEKHPDWAVYFSTLTNTGMRIAKQKLVDVDQIFFVPVDFAPVVRKFFKALKPRIFALAESEFWPNLLREAKRQSKGVFLINGRISGHSFRKYSRFKFLANKILKNIDFFLMQTEKDKENLEKIGVDSSKVTVVGNLKSEVCLPQLSHEELARIKKSLGITASRKVVVAGSTRKGEERMLLEAYAEARSRRENLLLVLAPRHPERSEEVERLARDFPFETMRRSRMTPEARWDVLVLDTLGELAQFYALSDEAFIGGSLVPWGGQNLLEPAFYEKPVFFGPHMENFQFLAEKFIQAGAARMINDKKELVEMFEMDDEKALREMGIKAKQTLNSLQGATDKTIKAIEIFMSEP